MIDIVFLRNYFSLTVLIGLPSADLNKRIIGIPEVNHQEKVALVTVSAGMPKLFECNTVDVVIFGMLYDINVFKSQQY